MRRLYKDHKDYVVLNRKLAAKLVLRHLDRLVREPSWDQFSEVCYATNRFTGALFGRKYIRICPFDQLHIMKCNHRYRLYQHFRKPYAEY